MFPRPYALVFSLLVLLPLVPACSGGSDDEEKYDPPPPPPICPNFAVAAPVTSIVPFPDVLTGVWIVDGNAESQCEDEFGQLLTVDLGGEWIVEQDGSALTIDMPGAEIAGTWTGTIEADGDFEIALDGNTITGRLFAFASGPTAWYVDDAQGDFTSYFLDARCPPPIQLDVDVRAVPGPASPAPVDLTGVWEMRFAEYDSAGCHPDVPALLTLSVVQDPETGFLQAVEQGAGAGLSFSGFIDPDGGEGVLGQSSGSCDFVIVFQVGSDGLLIGRGLRGETDANDEITCGTLFAAEGERIGL